MKNIKYKYNNQTKSTNPNKNQTEGLDPSSNTYRDKYLKYGGAESTSPSSNIWLAKYLKYDDPDKDHPKLDRDFKSLYLKYKNKYLMLKEILGGEIINTYEGLINKYPIIKFFEEIKDEEILLFSETQIFNIYLDLDKYVNSISDNEKLKDRIKLIKDKIQKIYNKSKTENIIKKNVKFTNVKFTYVFNFNNFNDMKNEINEKLNKLNNDNFLINDDKILEEDKNKINKLYNKWNEDKDQTFTIEKEKKNYFSASYTINIRLKDHKCENCEKDNCFCIKFAENFNLGKYLLIQ